MSHNEPVLMEAKSEDISIDVVIDHGQDLKLKRPTSNYMLEYKQRQKVAPFLNFMKILDIKKNENGFSDEKVFQKINDIRVETQRELFKRQYQKIKKMKKIDRLYLEFKKESQMNMKNHFISEKEYLNYLRRSNKKRGL